MLVRRSCWLLAASLFQEKGVGCVSTLWSFSCPPLPTGSSLLVGSRASHHMLVFLGFWGKVRFAILGSGVLEGLNIFFFLCFIPSSSLVYAPSPESARESDILTSRISMAINSMKAICWGGQGLRCLSTLQCATPLGRETTIFESTNGHGGSLLCCKCRCQEACFDNCFDRVSVHLVSTSRQFQCSRIRSGWQIQQALVRLLGGAEKTSRSQEYRPEI